MCFIDNHKFRTLDEKIVSSPGMLDELSGNNGKRIVVKHGYPDWEIPLQALNGSGEHEFRIDVKLILEFPLPLFCQVGWAKHC